MKIGVALMYNDITGIILADASIEKSKELEVLNKFSEKSIIEHLFKILKPLFKNIFIIAYNPDEYKYLNVKVYPEIYVGKGSLAQIHAGLFNSLTEKNFILSTDYPYITAEMINFIIDYPTESLITLPKGAGAVQVLSGVYSKRCMDVAEEILNKSISQEAEYFSDYKKCYKVSRMIDRIGAKLIPAELFPGYTEEVFYNLKSEELQEIL